MSKGNTFENDLLKLIYQATAIANMADNAATSPLTNIYVALHTAWPGEAGVQNTSECAYGSYARVAVARSGSGWTVTNNVVSPVASVEFPEATSGTESAMFFSTGVASSGATKILHMGVIGSSLGPFVGATNDTITIPGLSGLAVDDRIAFFAPPGAALPSGITEGTVYWVKTLSGDAITIAATQGGAAIDLTTVGDGVAFRVAPIAITTGVTPRLKNTMTITED